MPSSTPKPFYVPTIDIQPFLENPSGPGIDKIIDKVRDACLSTGFFQITGHGIPKTLQASLFQAAAAFFALEYEEKKKLDAKTHLGHRGYDVLASQSYEENVMPDLKEVFPSIHMLSFSSFGQSFSQFVCYTILLSHLKFMLLLFKSCFMLLAPSIMMCIAVTKFALTLKFSLCKES